MIGWLRSRFDREEGFTLVELMVVVLIIAILIAIAIPTFLGARQRAQDRAAQSNLRNALTAEKVYYTDEEYYATSGDAVFLKAIEPSLDFAAAVSPTDPTVIDVDVCDVTAGDQAAVAVSSQSASGTVFTLLDISTGTNAGTYYTSGTSATACTNAPGGAWATDGW